MPYNDDTPRIPISIFVTVCDIAETDNYIFDVLPQDNPGKDYTYDELKVMDASASVVAEEFAIMPYEYITIEHGVDIIGDYTDIYFFGVFLGRYGINGVCHHNRTLKTVIKDGCTTRCLDCNVVNPKLPYVTPYTKA